MTHFANTRKNSLSNWKTRSKRVFKVTDNDINSIECEWQNRATDSGCNHVSIFCSISQFVSHITDLLRDNRYDRYEFDQSKEVNEVLFRYYSRILLITSEILTDFQDLFILANNNLTTRQLGGIKGTNLRDLQDDARKSLSGNTQSISLLLDYINKVCKHKTSNLHICNHHIAFLFEDYHKNIKKQKKRIELGNINNFTSYNPMTFKKFDKADYIVVPPLNFIINIIIDCYGVINNLFKSDKSKFDFICEHYDDK